MKSSLFFAVFGVLAAAAATTHAAPVTPIAPRGENLALGRTYSLAPRPDYPHCTDPDDDKQLTDGIYTTGYFWTQQSTVGWQGGKPAAITIDLGKAEPICGASFNTAAGVAGVTWPTAISVLVSDDGKTFHEAGDLTDLSAPHGLAPATGYAVHRFWTDALRTHGRQVMFVVAGGSYTFVDEIEVYRGDPALLNLPLAGEAVTDAAAFVRARQVGLSVARRLRTDAQAVRDLSTNATIPAEVRRQVTDKLARVEAGIPGLPSRYGESFRAVLPLNALHDQVFRAQATIWRATGAARLTAWQSGLWDMLSPIHAAPIAGKPAVSMAMMQNEFRAGAFNLSNAGEADETLTLRITGLPGGSNPSWITVHEVQWTDTRSGVPVAAALPEATREGGAFVIRAKSGLTRQVWLTFHPTRVRPGLHQGRIVVSGHGPALEVPLSVRIFPLSFPDRPTVHLGGWDYTDTEGHFDITPENRPLVVAHLREHLVDSPWATAAVMPAGRFDAQGRQTTAPDTARFDEWLRRWPKAARYCVFMNVGGEWAGARMGTPQFDQRVGAWVRFWAEHAQRRGLKPEKLALLLVDEPTKPEQDAIILAWANAIHAAGTGVKVWEDPTHADPATANQEMLAACDVLCPNRPMFLADPKVRAYYTQHRPAGAELAFYSCSGPMRLLDPYSYLRLQAWSCWQNGARSSYFWAFSDSGGGSSWNEYAAKGAAYLPFFFDQTSVTAGKHMEAIRESAEDYEYLVMLRDRVAAAGKHGANDPALDRARKLLSEAAPRVCDAKGASALAWATDKDRTVADEVRLEILEVLAGLSRGGKQ
jgi:hypothetical protein